MLRRIPSLKTDCHGPFPTAMTHSNLQLAGKKRLS
jgi:hypothetical protein